MYTSGRLLISLVSQCINAAAFGSWLSVTSVACYTAGVPCGRLVGYSAKGEVSHNSRSMEWRRLKAWASTKRRSRWWRGRQLRTCCALRTRLSPADQCFALQA